MSEIFKKNYSKWHNLKSGIENFGKDKLFHDREIWWCSLGSNIGFEQDGKNLNFERPVLVLRKFNKDMFWGIPLTSREKDSRFYYKLVLSIKKENETDDKISWLILSQLRLLSGKRLIRRIARVNEKIFSEVEDSITALIKDSENKNGPLSGSSSA